MGEVSSVDLFWFNVAKKVIAELMELEATLALQRKQLRNAWAKLDCRCVFNDRDEKTLEDNHCPYHGWYQNDADAWNPLAELRDRLREEELDNEALTVEFIGPLTMASARISNEIRTRYEEVKRKEKLRVETRSSEGQ